MYERRSLDYLVKPIESDSLINAVNRAIKFHEINSENIRLRKYILSDELAHPDAFSEIITESKVMHGIFKYVEAIAETACPSRTEIVHL